MRLLLPPSESKTAPRRGSALDLSALTLPTLTEQRSVLLDALTALCTKDGETARVVLGLTTGQTDEILRNKTLLTAPTAPAWQVYTGVLYGALDAPTLTPAQRARLGERVWIASALFGFVGFTDRIPAYRLSADTTLPNLGTLTGFWRSSLSAALGDEPELVIDLRSGSYVKLGPVPLSIAERTVTVRILQKMPSGPPKLITHFNKATKGRIVRAIAQHRGRLRTAADFAQLVGTLGADVALLPATKTGQQIDIIVESV